MKVMEGQRFPFPYVEVNMAKRLSPIRKLQL
jgi:hypothetical protein